MFSDPVGSTALSARMDPEDLREVFSAYQTCVAETVHRFGGFVAKYMGDGVLICFRYPQAHEDDAERAGGWLVVAKVLIPRLHARKAPLSRFAMPSNSPTGARTAFRALLTTRQLVRDLLRSMTA
jgi:hypothetical protein